MESGNFLSKSDAASAVDASVHVSDNHWTDILILNCSFELVVSRSIKTIIFRVVLQVALTTLIADRAIERMVCKDEFHYGTSGNSGSL